MPDYLAIARQLRAKANYVPPEGSGLAPVPSAERAALLAKADELEAKYRNSNSTFTDDTTVTSRDGYFTFYHPNRATTVPPDKAAWDTVWNLFHNQYRWNKPPDESTIVEDEYAYEQEDEDYGYDIFEGDEPQ